MFLVFYYETSHHASSKLPLWFTQTDSQKLTILNDQNSFNPRNKLTRNWPPRKRETHSPSNRLLTTENRPRDPLSPGTFKNIKKVLWKHLSTTWNVSCNNIKINCLLKSKLSRNYTSWCTLKSCVTSGNPERSVMWYEFKEFRHHILVVEFFAFNSIHPGKNVTSRVDTPRWQFFKCLSGSRISVQFELWHSFVLILLWLFLLFSIFLSHFPFFIFSIFPLIISAERHFLH